MPEAKDPGLDQGADAMSIGWLSGEAECLDCMHEWVAVWPLAAEPLVCPCCGSNETDRTPMPADDLSKDQLSVARSTKPI